VPVGGTIISSFEAETITRISKFYPGRASSSQSLDVLMTLLSMGSDGYKQLLRERKECFSYLKSKLETLGANTNEKALVTPNNSISIAFSLSGLGGSQKDFTQIGSMLFTRNVTGVRVVAPGDTKEIGGVVFQNFNSHYNSYPCVYLTAAATIGIKKDEIDVFIKRLQKILDEKKA